MSDKLLAAIQDALHDILHPKPLKPICECGSIAAIQNHLGLTFPGKRTGIYCHRGHRLPGQDMPVTTTEQRSE